MERQKYKLGDMVVEVATGLSMTIASTWYTDTGKLYTCTWTSEDGYYYSARLDESKIIFLSDWVAYQRHKKIEELLK